MGRWRIAAAELDAFAKGYFFRCFARWTWWNSAQPSSRWYNAPATQQQTLSRNIHLIPFFISTPKAKKDITDQKLENFFCVGLQDWQPEPGRYDMIWCQWVLSHLTDDDLVSLPLLSFVQNDGRHRDKHYYSAVRPPTAVLRQYSPTWLSFLLSPGELSATLQSGLGPWRVCLRQGKPCAAR